MQPLAVSTELGGERTLTVASRWGLCNRLRLLLSGLVVAEATGRRFAMLWPRSFDCGAAFHELFTNDLNVQNEPIPGNTRIYGLWLDGPPWQDFLVSSEPHLLVVTPTWLLQPEIFPQHEALMQRCAKLLTSLQPAPLVAERAAAFKAQHFQKRMIGVHLRRGDFTVSQHARNLASALAHVDQFLTVAPDAGIFLSTDDGAVNQNTGRPTRREDVRQRFVQAYGDRVCFTAPRSLDRRTTEAVQDALVDLLLLRETQFVVGTKSSSFSHMAVLGRSVPAVFCTMSQEEQRRQTAMAVITGVYPVLKLAGWIQFRKDLPFPRLKAYYRHRLDDAGRRARQPLRRVRNRAALRLKERSPRLFAMLRALKRRGNAR